MRGSPGWHSTRRSRAAAWLLALALVAAACGSDADRQSIGAGGATGEPVGEEHADDEALHAGPDGGDRVVYGWYLGLPIRPSAIVPPAYGGDGPEEPSPDVADLTVYLVGPVDDVSPVGPEVEIPGPDGETVVLPPHQQTHDLIVPAEDPHDAIGVFVVPGPNATDETVRTRPEPERSVVGAPLAYAVRMGAVWAPLRNHTVIEWGVERGLLETVPFEYGGLMWTEFIDEQPITLTCAPTAPPPPREAPPAPGPPPGPPPGEDGDAPENGAPTGEGGPPPGDASHGPGEEFVVYGWYAGLPMRPAAILPAAYGGPGPDGPADDVPDVTVYLTAPVDPEAPSAPAREGIPTPDGPRALPAHSQTHDRLVPSDEPHDAMGVFVVPGPQATEESVRWDEEPPDSVAGAPLASAVKLGPVWVPLSHHLAIEHGVAASLLELVPFEYGGLLWHTFDDDEHWLDCG